jgi:hypothetical protein
MKIYFDNVEDLDFPNCTELSRSGDNTFWLTASGTRMKKELRQLNVPYYKLDDIDEPGLYFVEVNGYYWLDYSKYLLLLLLLLWNKFLTK